MIKFSRMVKSVSTKIAERTESNVAEGISLKIT